MTDSKGELFEKLPPYFIEKGHYVKAVNFLDMAHSDGWNCLCSLEKETRLARTVANTAFSSYEYRFWTRSWPWTVIFAICSTNVCNFFLLNNKSQRACAARRQERPRGRPPSAALPPEHPAKGHHGLFLKARENLWGNIGYMEGIADALNSIRGFNMSCQVVVQSLSQWQDWMALSSFAA